ncbi:2-amino-4-hydroxy-6-hydroxymethyldihydropteridine diphosphokinase [uncultured Polaribacter sp.]|uniref:2-amino-4-hydroxy-6- hydroxymethyldihydropteridine diphosphokinase n=1 Tax=uncultured Polaribacter sp. TaxID=174711 RepID=UPI00261EE0AF|nr:2-amino-4-hydroxy-6-hydroxymethyldihydropteridine diphosphokinase [uncultured Polaribacter sp.]
MKVTKITYLSLGTNEGNKAENLQNAIHAIADKVGDVQKISSIYKTASWGFNGNDFYNICIKLSTNLSPEMVLESVLNIETTLGRERTGAKEYQNRNIDIDILLFNNEIILSKDLIVPHPKMLDRKFVLVPLAEIAPSVIHPIEKEKITICLQNCEDNSEITIVNKELKRPIPLKEKYNYIAIEGNIGAGKTSLTKMMSQEFNAKTVLEQFSENSFLPKFYKDQARYAFPLEMSFLMDRQEQLSKDLAQYSLSENSIISDYYILKSIIFAEITLSKDEFLLYKKMFNFIYKEITKPDLYVYLHQNTDKLIENIKKRGRAYEKNISAAYLQKIENGYHNFMKSQNDLNYLIIDISDLNFVENPEDYNYIIQKIINN